MRSSDERRSLTANARCSAAYAHTCARYDSPSWWIARLLIGVESGVVEGGCYCSSV
jgi:hypothetical protein